MFNNFYNYLIATLIKKITQKNLFKSNKINFYIKLSREFIENADIKQTLN